MQVFSFPCWDCLHADLTEILMWSHSHNKSLSLVPFSSAPAWFQIMSPTFGFTFLAIIMQWWGIQYHAKTSHTKKKSLYKTKIKVLVPYLPYIFVKKLFVWYPIKIKGSIILWNTSLFLFGMSNYWFKEQQQIITQNQKKNILDE